MTGRFISRHDKDSLPIMEVCPPGQVEVNSGSCIWRVFRLSETHERHTPLGDFPQANVSVKPIPRFWGDLKLGMLPLLLGRSLASLGLAATEWKWWDENHSNNNVFVLFNMSFPWSHKPHEDKDLLYLLHCLS